MSEIKIRHSHNNDIKDITDIYACESTYLNTLQLPFPSEASWERRLANMDRGSYSLVAEINGKVVGHIGLYIQQNLRRKHVATFGMAVDESFQKKGIGNRLLLAVIDLADKWLNIQRLEL